MSIFGTVHLYCPICGTKFPYGDNTYDPMHHKQYGIVCSKPCFKSAELKYARFILGKDEK